jgi:hypothetical protein
MPSLQNFYCRDDELADRYEISISQKAMFFFTFMYIFSLLYHRQKQLFPS